MYHFVFPVVKAQAIPSGVHMPVARIEKLVRVAGKVSQAFAFVFCRMRMHKVHYYGQSFGMCFIN